MPMIPNYNNNQNIRCVKLDTGKIVEFKMQSKSEKQGREYLSHVKKLVYLGEGVFYSHNGIVDILTEKAHFFTW